MILRCVAIHPLYIARMSRGGNSAVLYLALMVFVMVTIQIQLLLPNLAYERRVCLEEVWKRYDARHTQPIFLFWSNAEGVMRNDLQDRHYVVLEQLMVLHPRAPIIVVSDTLPPHIFEDYTHLGYNISVRRFDIKDLTFGIPGLQAWVEKIPTWRKGPYFASHMSDYYRFALTYMFGGTYTDFDALYLRPLTFLESAVGVDRAAGNCPWCLPESESSLHGPVYTAPGVMIGFPVRMGMMLQTLVRGFAISYDPECFVCVGPKALTLSISSIRAQTGALPGGDVTLLDSFELYPYNYQQIPGMFEATNSSREQYKMLRRNARSIHLFGKVSSALHINHGSVIDFATREIRVVSSFDSGTTDRLHLSAPDLFDLSRRAYLNVYLFDDIRVIDCAQLPGDSYEIFISVEEGTLHTRKLSGRSLHISGSLLRLNEFLSSLVYVGGPRDQVNVVVVGARSRTSITIPVMQIEHLLTIQVKTHGRPDKVGALIRSVRRYYSNMPILVGDDSRDSLNTLVNLTELRNTEFVSLPVDSGLSFGRNVMVQMTKTLYTMVIDDDHIFTGHTDLTGLVRTLESGNYDILAMKSPVDFERWHSDFAGVMSIENNSLILDGGNRGLHYGCEMVDFAHNKFVARVERLKVVPWNSKLKLGEHEDFYWRAKVAGLRVGSCAWASIYHDSPPHWLKRTHYDIQRGRVFQFMELMLTLNGWDCISNFGAKICRDKNKTVDTKREICSVGFVGERCDKCDVGFLGDRCDTCEAGRYSAACVPCNCPNKDTVCQEGYKSGGECTCKCPLVRGENLLHNAELKQEGVPDAFKAPIFWTTMNAESGPIVSPGSVAFRHEKMVFSGLQQYISLANLKPTELIIGADIRANLSSGGDPSDGFSLYTDAWYEDGSVEWGKVLPLPLGTYDWQTYEGTLQWPRPIVGLTFTLMFKLHSGEVEYRQPYVKEPICNCSQQIIDICKPITRSNCHPKHEDANCGCAPEMIGIGVEKAGTTSLWFWLAQHPQFVARDKEVRFEFSNYAGRLQKYYDKFPDVPRNSELVTGDFTPSYIMDPVAPESLAKLAPLATYVVVLRDPIERAYSQYSMDHTEGRNNLSFGESVRRELAALREFGIERANSIKNVTWEALSRYLYEPAVIKRHGLIEGSYIVSTGLYELQLQSWYRVIGQERFLLLDFAELEKSPVAVLERIAGRLGLRAFDWSSVIGTRWGTVRQGAPDNKTVEVLRWYFAP